MILKLIKFNCVKSTNDEAIKIIRSKKNSKGIVVSNLQTKGRGTHGKRWISKKGNFFGSIFFPLKDDYPPFNEFFVISPIIVSEIIEKFCVGKKISFKWPNDLLINGKKICGILQEIVTLNKNKFLIIGIGINVISSPDINIEYKATNILKETKKKPHINEIINLMISSYENFFINLNIYSFSKFYLFTIFNCFNFRCSSRHYITKGYYKS